MGTLRVKMKMSTKRVRSIELGLHIFFSTLSAPTLEILRPIASTSGEGSGGSAHRIDSPEPSLLAHTQRMDVRYGICDNND